MNFQWLVACAVEEIVGYLEEDATEAEWQHCWVPMLRVLLSGIEAVTRISQMVVEVLEKIPKNWVGSWATEMVCGFRRSKKLMRWESEVTWRLMLYCFGTRSEVFHRTRHNWRRNLEMVKPFDGA